jgi:hypothetical protein
MTWTELRPKLQEQFGKTFSFYNDKYRSGKRRIKIGYRYPYKFLSYIKKIAPELDAKIYVEYPGAEPLVTIHYNK